MHHEYVFRTGQQCPRCNRELIKSRTENVFVWCEDVYCGYGKVKMEREGLELKVDSCGPPSDVPMQMSFETCCDVREQKAFTSYFNSVAKQCHETAVEKGWWDEAFAKDRTFASFIANTQAELSECWEFYRKSLKDPILSDHIPDFFGIEEELADVIIRIMDMACKYEIRVAEALVAKIAYNKTRPYRHGGKKA